MYVNSSLTAQRIAKICTGLRFFRIRDSTHQRENFSLGILVELEVSLDSKRCRSLFELEVFLGEEAGTLSGSRHHLLKTLFF